MLIPLRTDSPLRNTPYLNWGLIAANVAVFLYSISHPEFSEAFALSPRHPHLVEFFSYQFLHAGWMHLVGNMLFLYIFGNNVNDRLGHLGYLALYLAGGVFAGISYVMSTSGDATLVGASGSIAAVTGAYLVLLPRSNITIVYFFFYLPGVAEIASLWFILGFFAYDIFLNISVHDGIAHTAHIGGTIFGALICMSLLWMQLLPRDQFDVLAMIDRWNRRRQYRDMVAGGYNPFEYTQPSRSMPFGSSSKPPPPPDPKTARLLGMRGEIADALSAHDLPSAAGVYADLKKLDPTQVLPKQQQLDIATHLHSQQSYPEAVEAYETYLRHYPKSDKLAEVELMLGLIYSDLNQPDRARDLLTRAASKYHAGREYDLAQAELHRLEIASRPPPPPPR